MVLDEIRPMSFFTKSFFQQKYGGKIVTFKKKSKFDYFWFFWSEAGNFPNFIFFHKIGKNTRGYYEYIVCYFAIIFGIWKSINLTLLDLKRFRIYVMHEPITM